MYMYMYVCIYQGRVGIKVGSESVASSRTVPNRIGSDHYESQGLLRTVPNRFGTLPFVRYPSDRIRGVARVGEEN